MPSTVSRPRQVSKPLRGQIWRAATGDPLFHVCRRTEFGWSEFRVQVTSNVLPAVVVWRTKDASVGPCSLRTTHQATFEVGMECMCRSRRGSVRRDFEVST
eukprot:508015-Pleurochrysis_carterae.AAC.2